MGFLDDSKAYENEVNAFIQTVNQPTNRTMTLQFKKAVRTTVKLKILLTGPSGSGKTLGALTLASYLAPGSVAGIDSEHERMVYYADKVDFAHLSLSDVSPASYIAAIDAAVAGGFQICVIDSLSHCWNDLLDRKNALERSKPGSNGFTLWGIFGAEWEKLVQHILRAPIHVIATSRSKQAYEQTTDAQGKKKVEKLGLAPQVRDGAEYEFALAFDLNRTHRGECTKDNTGMFSGENAVWDLCDPKIATMLQQWMAGAVAAPTPAAISDAQRQELIDLLMSDVFTDTERAGVMQSALTYADALQRLVEVRAAIAERVPALATV